LTLALDIGRAIRESRERCETPVEGFLTALGGLPGQRHCRLLFEGKITDVIHETRDGWHFGQATLENPQSESPDESAQFVIDIQNEYLIARRNGLPAAMVPDIISLLDQESAEPLTAEMLRYGQRVAVVGYSAPAVLRRPESLSVVGPRSFGLKEDYVPLESLPDFEKRL
jgi:DUF917 family protein